MVSYNTKRFIFMFDPINEKLVGVYDKDYSTTYTVQHPAFIQVFACAIELLADDSLKELEQKITSEHKYRMAIRKVLYSRENSKGSK